MYEGFFYEAILFFLSGFSLRFLSKVRALGTITGLLSSHSGCIFSPEMLTPMCQVLPCAPEESGAWPRVL